MKIQSLTKQSFTIKTGNKVYGCSFRKDSGIYFGKVSIYNPDAWDNKEMSDKVWTNISLQAKKPLKAKAELVEWVKNNLI